MNAITLFLDIGAEWKSHVWLGGASRLYLGNEEVQVQVYMLLERGRPPLPPVRGDFACLSEVCGTTGLDQGSSCQQGVGEESVRTILPSDDQHRHDGRVPSGLRIMTSAGDWDVLAMLRQ